jgi:hypothetical protein
VQLSFISAINIGYLLPLGCTNDCTLRNLLQYLLQGLFQDLSTIDQDPVPFRKFN